VRGGDDHHTQDTRPAIWDRPIFDGCLLLERKGAAELSDLYFNDSPTYLSTQIIMLDISPSLLWTQSHLGMWQKTSLARKNFFERNRRIEFA
jgi:hypothetical protein